MQICRPEIALPTNPLRFSGNDILLDTRFQSSCSTQPDYYCNTRCAYPLQAYPSALVVSENGGILLGTTGPTAITELAVQLSVAPAGGALVYLTAYFVDATVSSSCFFCKSGIINRTHDMLAMKFM
jgi:hypothetical protein